jgi:hypothetical protein
LWEDVRVLVSIEVRDRDSRRLQPADLRNRFRLDLLFSQTTSNSARSKAGETVLQAGGIMRVEEAANLLDVEDGKTVYQHNVAANTEPGRRLRRPGSLSKGGPGGHQGGGRDHTVSMRLQYSAIHPGREPEVVGVDNQAAQRASLQHLAPRGPYLV